MYTLQDSAPDIERYLAALSSCGARIIAALTPAEASTVIPAGSDLIALCSDQSSFFAVREGNPVLSRAGRQLLFYSEGDVIGLDYLDPSAGFEIKADFGIVLDRFSRESMTRAAAADGGLLSAVMEYLGNLSGFYTLLAALNMGGDLAVNPEVKHFKKGDVIITQGDPPDLVYTLVQGAAEAFVDSVKVGDINADEVFGMLAVFTNTPRTATVVAAQGCVAVAIPKERFIELIQQKPHTVLKLIEDMSKTIVSLNERVVQLKRSIL